MKKYWKGASTIQKVAIVAILCVFLVLALSFGAAAMGFVKEGEPAPSYSDADSSHLTDECDIPPEYIEVFEKGAAKFNNAPPFPFGSIVLRRRTWKQLAQKQRW